MPEKPVQKTQSIQNKQKHKKSQQSQILDSQFQGPPPQKLTNYMFHNIFNQRCIRRYVFQFLQCKKKREMCYSARISDGSFRVKIIIVRENAAYIQKKIIKPFTIIDGTLEYCGDSIIFLKVVYRHYEFPFAIGNTIPWRYNTYNHNQNGWNTIDWEKAKKSVEPNQKQKNTEKNLVEPVIALKSQQRQIESKKKKQQKTITNSNQTIQKQKAKINSEIHQAKLVDQCKEQQIKQKIKLEDDAPIKKISQRKLLLKSQNQNQVQKQLQIQKLEQQNKLQTCEDDLDLLLDEIVQNKSNDIFRKNCPSKKQAQNMINTQTRQQKIKQILNFLEQSQFPQTKSEGGDKHMQSNKSKYVNENHQKIKQKQKASKNKQLQSDSNQKELNKSPQLKWVSQRLNDQGQIKGSKNNVKKIKQQCSKSQTVSFKKSGVKVKISKQFDYEGLFQEQQTSVDQPQKLIKKQAEQPPKFVTKLQNLIHCSSSITEQSWIQFKFHIISDQISEQKINKTDKKITTFRKAICCNQEMTVMIPCRIDSTLQLIQNVLYYCRKIIVKQVSSEGIKVPYAPLIFFILADSHIIIPHKISKQTYDKKNDWVTSIQKIVNEKQDGETVNFIGIIKSCKIIKLNQKTAKGDNSNTSCLTSNKMVNMEIVDPFTGYSISFIDFSNKFSFQSHNIKYLSISIIQAKVSIYKNRKGTKAHFSTLYKINFMPSHSQKQKWDNFIKTNYQNMPNLIENLQIQLNGYKEFQSVDDIYFSQQNSKGIICCEIISIRKMKYIGCATCLKKVVQEYCRSCGQRGKDDVKLYEFVTGVFADCSGSIKFNFSNECIANLKNKISKEIAEFQQKNRLQLQELTTLLNVPIDKRNNQNEQEQFQNLILQYAEIWFTKSTNNKPITVDRVRLHEKIVKNKISGLIQQIKG